jgi:beta-galactosidase beta subunit
MMRKRCIDCKRCIRTPQGAALCDKRDIELNENQFILCMVLEPHKYNKCTLFEKEEEKK